MTFKRLANDKYTKSFPAGGLPPQAAALGSHFAASTALIDQILAKAEAIKADARYSDIGRKAALQEWFTQEALPVLTKARQAMAQADQDLAGIRQAMTTSSIDKSDIASALLRRECRDILKQMDTAKKAALLTVDPDPIYVQSIVEAPAEFSGVSANQKALLAAKAMALAHPDQAKDANLTEEALQATAEAEGAASLAVREALGMSEVELNQALGIPSKMDHIRTELAEDTGQ